MYSVFVVRTRRHFFFFFNDTATTEIYTLSLHDALPIFHPTSGYLLVQAIETAHKGRFPASRRADEDRKSTRLNSSHGYISYAVFCLKKKITTQKPDASSPTSLSAPSSESCCSSTTSTSC